MAKQRTERPQRSHKAIKGERKETDKEFKLLVKRIKANEKALKQQPQLAAEIAQLKTEAAKYEAELQRFGGMIENEESRMAKHTELEEELKACKKKVKEIKDHKQALVDKARLLITPEEAKELIMKRWLRTLQQTVNDYLQAHQRQLLQAVENVWEKYTNTLHGILDSREADTKH